MTDTERNEFEKLQAAVTDASYELGSEDFMPRLDWRLKHSETIRKAKEGATK